MQLKTMILAGIWFVSAAMPCFAQEGIQVDNKLPTYTKASGVAGNLNSIGSDTLNNLMTLWAESFRREYPNVRIQIEGRGLRRRPRL